MQTVIEAIQSIRVWQVAVLVVVILAGAGSAYGAFRVVSDSDEVDLAENQQLVPVQRGDLVNEVSISGSLAYPNRQSLTFGIQGTVADIVVEEGQRVSEGQLLAALDGVTVTSLEKAAAQARVNVQHAEEALAAALSPYTGLDVARAEADVANARLSLRNAEEALAVLTDTNAQALAQSEAAVVDGKISVQDATDALQTLMSGPTDEELGEVRSQITSAETTLANADRDLKLAQKEWDGNVERAADSVDDAVAAYTSVFDKWLGIELDEQQSSMDPDALLASWDADLEALFTLAYGSNDLDKWASPLGIPDDDPTTPWNERVVYSWVNFYPGAIEITCSNDVAPFRGECISKEMGDTWSGYQDAMDGLDTVQTQAEKAAAVAETSVAKSEDGVAALNDTLTELLADADPLDIESKERRLDVAVAVLQSAEEDVADLVGGPDEVEVEAKRKQVDVARLTLEQAADDLAELLVGTDPLDIALLEADRASATAALEEATQRLENAIVEAPWDAVVAAVNVESGQNVNANTPVMEIVDPSIIEVDGIVDEIDVLFIREGARASVTMDALGGQVLSGTVSEIAAQGTSNQGVVSYPMHIQVDVPANLDLPEGLSATASVVIREDLDVLLIPLDSLYGSFENPIVRVMNGVVEEREVVLGNSDDFWVVVQSGLAEAELVVMEASQASEAGGFGGLRGLFGGGAPAGGFGGGGGGFGGGGGGGGRR